MVGTNFHVATPGFRDLPCKTGAWSADGTVLAIAFAHIGTDATRVAVYTQQIKNNSGNLKFVEIKILKIRIRIMNPDLVLFIITISYAIKLLIQFFP